MFNQDTSKLIDMPANLFSNLGGENFKVEVKAADNNIVKVNNELASDMKEYYERDLKLNKLNNNDYRKRLTKMYEELKGLNPIDKDIEDNLFTHNYIEKGIVIKPTIQDLKQFWTEYRLMDNERKNNTSSNVTITNPLENFKELSENKKEFEDLFDKLTSRVEEINKYIDELKEMKEEIDSTQKEINLSKEQIRADKEEIKEKEEKLEQDRQEFLNYKQVEEEKLRKEKENLKINFNKFQTIIDSLNEKLNEVE